MSDQNAYWPDRAERQLVGRFYLAEGFSEVFNVVFPFRFIYLYMVMEHPEWAVVPLFVESATVLLMEIPTGAVADRWGRKLSVISGGVLYAVSLLFIPFAVSQSGTMQLWAVCASFAVGGLGQTLISGAEEAWVVDNLASAGRHDLIDRYFARIRSFASFGGVGAGCLALIILLSANITRPILDGLWYLAALGFLAAVAMAATIPERRPAQEDLLEPVQGPGLLSQLLQGFRVIGRTRALAMLAIAIVIAAFSGSIADEAFDISMVTKGLDARALAPLGILTDLIGIVAPLVGVVLARRFGASRVLVAFLILPATLVFVFFIAPPLWAIVGVYLLLAFFDDVWDPVAEANLQRLIPSSSRATAGSTVNQVSGLANLGGIGLFALLLGEHSEALREATPDLIAAFSGGVVSHPHVPTGLFGLPVPDLVIVVFVLSGVLAIPFLLLGRLPKATEQKP